MRTIEIEDNVHKVTETLPISPAMARHIAEVGNTTRKKAIELGILPGDLYIPPTKYINRATGDGYKVFKHVSKETLFQEIGATSIAWRILDKDNQVLLEKGW